MASKLDNDSLFKDIPVTARHDVYPAISPEPYFSGSSTAFHDKVVLVAGASKGIGFSIASFYARAGAKLAILSRSQKTLDEAKDRIVSESGVSAADVFALATDVADTKGIEELVGKVVEKYGRLDVVVANTAITGPWKKPFADNDPYEDWWKVLEVNIRGTYNVAHYVFPHLTKTNGTFVALTSMAAQRNLPFASAYSVSKVAVDRFIEFAAIEYPSVRSFAVHPGTIKTDGSIAALPEWAPRMIDTLQLPAATILKLTDGSGRFDWLSGRFISAGWDLEELERDWKDEILNKGMMVTRFIA